MTEMVTVPVRLTPELHEALRTTAAEADRSMAGQIRHAIRASLRAAAATESDPT